MGSKPELAPCPARLAKPVKRAAQKLDIFVETVLIAALEFLLRGVVDQLSQAGAQGRQPAPLSPKDEGREACAQRPLDQQREKDRPAPGQSGASLRSIPPRPRPPPRSREEAKTAY
jgi:hypothetical protein